MLNITKLLERALVHSLMQTTRIENNSSSSLSNITYQNLHTPEAENMKFWRDAEHLKSKVHTLQEPYTTSLKEVICCPKSSILLTRSREVILESIPASFKHGFAKNYNTLGEIFLSKVERISEPCTMFHSCFKGYYPSLIYSMPRLYLLHQPEYASKTIKLLISRPLTEAEKFFFPKILPENVEILPLKEDRNYLAGDYIFLNFLTTTGALPSEYLSFFTKRVCPKRERKRINRIFISRKKSSKGRQVLNEDELFEALSRYGFRRYLLEDMFPEEQVNLFYDSEYVISPHGAGLTNILFADKINVIELFPSKFIWTPAYYFLAKSMGHTYQYLCNEEELEYENFGVKLSKQGLSPVSYFKNRSFNVDIPKILKLLETTLND